MDALQPRLTGWIPHVPTERQHAALLCDEYLEGLYGGAAGGGKSDFLLMAALQYVDVPGYSALLLRRTFKDLSEPGALLPRAQEWLEGTSAIGAASVDGYPTRWDFPSGAVLSLNHCQHAKDRFNYKSAEYQFIGFDELTGFEEVIYRYLFSRLRRLSACDVPLRVRSASNPGGIGHEWVKARFVTGESVTEGEERPFFLPSRLVDNPHIDQEEYRRSLGNLFEYEREQLEEGNWDAQKPGTLLHRVWFKIIEGDEVPRLSRECRFWDCAGTKPKDQHADGGPAWTVGVRGGAPLDPKHEFSFIIRDVDRFREDPGGVESRIIQRAAIDGREVPVREEQEPGSAGKRVVWAMSRALRGYDYRGIPSSGDKITRARTYISDAKKGQIALVRSTWNEPFLREMESVSIPPSGFMDQFDAGASCHSECTLSRGVTPADLYGPPPDEAAA